MIAGHARGDANRPARGVDVMRKIIVLSIFICLLILLPGPSARADTVRLIEGSVLIGKIIEEDSSRLVLANFHGTFNVRMEYVIDIKRTKSYKEDINILKKMSADVDENMVKKNVETGEKKIAEMKNGAEALKGKSGNRWVHGRICASGSYYYVPGRVGNLLPGGFSGHLSLDQGLDMALVKHHPLVPGLRFEGSYLNFRKNSYSITGYSGGGGLMWAMPSMNNRGGCFVFAIMPGVSWLDIKNSQAGKRAKSLTFSGSAIAGYQVSFGVFSMFIHARYEYIYDSSVPFHSIGGECGFGFNAW
jgi:hypothetical protein